MTPPLALSCGDPSGIGGEIAALAWRAMHAPMAGAAGGSAAGGAAAFFLIGDADWAAGFGAPVARIAAPDEAAAAFGTALPVLHRPFAALPRPGAPDPANAPATIAAIAEAAALCLAGDAAAMTTLPISKKALYDGADFAFPGHTEFLAHLGGVERSVMMLAAPGLRVVPVTIHMPLADVPAALSGEAIMSAARILHAALKSDFAIADPRIAVAGLNPHAGEGGAMGREEIEIIAPALDRLRAEGLDLTGPLPADTMFHAAARARHDAALCMYHDQALIPIKTLAFDKGVNVTLGLPFIRTSPDHGTAHDIAGKGLADPGSLIAALALARDMAAARRRRGAS